VFIDSQVSELYC